MKFPAFEDILATAILVFVVVVAVMACLSSGKTDYCFVRDEAVVQHRPWRPDGTFVTVKNLEETVAAMKACQETVKP